MVRVLLVVGVCGCLSACAFPPDVGPFGPDPLADRFATLNEVYGAGWLQVPTGLGNSAGAIASAPLAVVLAPFEWVLLGWTDESPLFTGTMSLGAYVGGFLAGTPFVLGDAGVRGLVPGG